MESTFDALGVKIHAVQIADVLERMREWIRIRDRSHSVVHCNVYTLTCAHRDPAFRQILNSSDLVVADGMPLVWIGRRAGHGAMKERVYGPDLMLASMEYFRPLGVRHYFYGGSEGVAQELARRMDARFPGLAVAGAEAPPYLTTVAQESPERIERINQSRPDILWVGLGSPKQEQWMNLHRERLQVPVILGVGAAFDFFTGRVRQAPTWMRSHGLEWAFRLGSEPRRLWKRYLWGNSLFLYLLWKESLKRRRQSRLPP